MTNRLDVFDQTIHRTRIWIQHLMKELAIEEPLTAYLYLRATLHGLRDHLDCEDAIKLGNQIPLLLRAAYFENWRPSSLSSRKSLSGMKDFINTISHQLPETDSMTEIEQNIWGVFRYLSKKIRAGELENIRSFLPRDLREIWNEDMVAA